MAISGKFTKRPDEERKSSTRKPSGTYAGRSSGRADEDKPKTRASSTGRSATGRSAPRDDSRPSSRSGRPVVRPARPLSEGSAAPARHHVRRNSNDSPRGPSTRSPSLSGGPSGERLQKLLADYGLGSRREIEGWIEAGRLTINKNPAKLGDKAEIADLIELDGKALKLFARMVETPRVILYHKAEGQVCSRHSTETNESVFLNLPKLRTARWVMVGRLDIATSGLLLFTTSGELANRLMHPSNEIEREYSCRIFSEDITLDQMKAMKKGIEDEGEILKFESIRPQGGEGRNHWHNVVIKTGKNREVRRIFESQELVVSRLIRIRFGDLLLPPRLKKKDYVELDFEKDFRFLPPAKPVKRVKKS